MIDTSSIQARDKYRSEHDRLIAEFLAGGGEIQVLEHIERAPIRQAEWNYTITPNENNRKEFLRMERQIAEHGRALSDIGMTAEQALKQMKKRWNGQCVLSLPKIEQLAARFGYAFSIIGRGRP